MENNFLASVIQSLDLKKNDKIYPYKPARLVDCSGDLSKRWYVIFYVWNENLNDGEGGLERKRTYDINKYPTDVLRREAGEMLVDNINSMLKKGMCIRKDLPEDKFKSAININKFKLLDAIDLHIKNNSTTLSDKTLRGYTTLKNALEPWLEDNGIADIRLIDFNLEMANSFFNWLKNDRIDRYGNKGMGNKTWNNYHTNFNAVYNAYISQELIKKKKNVIRKLKKKRALSGKHVPFAPEQLKKILSFLRKEGEDQLLLFIQFIYYTFTRPGTETRFLKVSDIRKDTIFIPAESAKSDRGEHISIPPGLEKLIVQHKLRSYPPEYYIFSNKGEPGENPVGPSYFWKRHRKHLDSLELTDKEYTLYSYKHTGNIMLYLSGADPIAVQRHNRHTTLDITMKYLRDLGLIRNEDVIMKFPDFGAGYKKEKSEPLIEVPAPLMK